MSIESCWQITKSWQITKYILTNEINQHIIAIYQQISAQKGESEVKYVLENFN